ncbi:hypothetical protein [Clostridium magnum]|nr:hypothetical protein [Clostridium magnum]
MKKLEDELNNSIGINRQTVAVIIDKSQEVNQYLNMYKKSKLRFPEN